jgi:hypothetical protein
MNDDRDEYNPVDMTAEEWADFYSDLPDFEDFIDHDMSMNH